ncbi:hypothetical protein OOT00_04915 [Desulfobotulus sp. H1]|uniref:Nuclear transport factor 2 family protein n=1 Tax=Desulfobotulus pelophilus TaxID=2823377 RepID=A0ABT3N7A0_9BACT|nr:hypothetical protein [Desulfobotulus pelophilus]MCW7753326.1 hypothetical protein [Desulfobotulus pelophilus]
MTGKNVLRIIVCLSVMAVGGGVTAASVEEPPDTIPAKDHVRVTMEVEAVLGQLVAAYRAGSVSEFFGLVSEAHFRQSPSIFRDALQSDSRQYMIHHVDYWPERVVSDHTRHFLFVRWEKRFELLGSGGVQTVRGYSRFLFEERDGQYFLVELAGNGLFGSSLPEWEDSLPKIPGQEAGPSFP